MVRLIGFLLVLLLGLSSVWAKMPEQADKIMNHLEFLGYDVSQNGQRIAARHEKYLNLLIRSYEGGILVSGFFRGTEFGKANQAKWLEILNKLNRKSTVAKYYIDKDGDLAIEAYYPGVYNKKAFGIFIDNLQQDNLQFVLYYDQLAKFIE